MAVYFIQAAHDGPIKIGHSRNVDQRLHALRMGSPHRLNLRALIEGDAEKERELHERFSAHHVNGEWFAPAPELLDYIQAVAPPPAPTWSPPAPGTPWSIDDVIARIRDFARRHSLTPSALAIRAGLSIGTLREFDRDWSPRPETIRRLEAHMNAVEPSSARSESQAA